MKIQFELHLHDLEFKPFDNIELIQSRSARRLLLRWAYGGNKKIIGNQLQDVLRVKYFTSPHFGLLGSAWIENPNSYIVNTSTWVSNSHHLLPPPRDPGQHRSLTTNTVQLPLKYFLVLLFVEIIFSIIFLSIIHHIRCLLDLLLITSACYFEHTKHFYYHKQSHNTCKK